MELPNPDHCQESKHQLDDFTLLKITKNRKKQSRFDTKYLNALLYKKGINNK